MKIGTKIMLVGIPLALLAVIVSSVFAGISSRNALEKAAFERLTAVRELKAQQIESYFDLMSDQAVSLAASPETFEAIAAFTYSEFLLNGTIKDTDPEDTAAIAEYYNTVISRRIEETGILSTSLTTHIPTNPLSVHMQLEFVVGSDRAATVGPDDLQYAYYLKKIKEADVLYEDFTKRFGYNDVFLISQKSSRIIYSTMRGIEFGTSLRDGPHSGSNLAVVVKAAMGLEAGEYIFADFEKYMPAFGAPTAFVASPIFRLSLRNVCVHGMFFLNSRR